MKTLFRWVFRLFVLSIVLVVALVLLKDTLVKAIAERQIRAQTGMDVKIGKFELGLLSPTLSIEDFKIYNTAEFGGSPFLVMPELHVECEGSDLMAHRLHLKLVRFNLAEINIVQNKQGKSNLQALQTKLAENQSKPTNEVPYFTFAGVDMLNLTLGKLKTLSLARPDHVDEIDFGIRNEVITNVKSAKELTQALLNLMLKRGVNLMGGPKPGDAVKGRENGLKKAIEQVSTPSRK